MSTLVRTAALGFALTIATGLASGCSSEGETRTDPGFVDDGSSTGDSPDTSTDGDIDTSSGVPSCDMVWIAGATLPDDYEGCEDASGVHAMVATNCTNGSGFVTYDDTHYAVLGGEIAEGGADDAGYTEAFDTCLS